jgi:hypothetical protein
MIDSLANNNREPGMTYLDEPLFAPSYDWKEARRVRGVYLELLNNDSEALWEEFLKHLDDDRYSLTIGRGNGMAMNYSVGSLCRHLAYDRLAIAFYEDLPTGDEGRPLVPKMRIWDDLAAWREERKSKFLYELQIDACQLAIDKVTQELELSAAEKRECRQKINRRIAALKDAKKPVFRKQPSVEYEWYDADKARRIRDRAGRKSQGDEPETEKK